MIKNSSKLCPRCKQEDIPLRWSENEHPPTVNFSLSDGHVSSVSLMRYCIGCGYREIGYVQVNKTPIWTEKKEEAET